MSSDPVSPLGPLNQTSSLHTSTPSRQSGEGDDPKTDSQPHTDSTRQRLVPTPQPVSSPSMSRPAHLASNRNGGQHQHQQEGPESGSLYQFYQSCRDFGLYNYTLGSFVDATQRQIANFSSPRDDSLIPTRSNQYGMGGKQLGHERDYDHDNFAQYQHPTSTSSAAILTDIDLSRHFEEIANQQRFVHDDFDDGHVNGPHNNINNNNHYNHNPRFNRRSGSMMGSDGLSESGEQGDDHDDDNDDHHHHSSTTTPFLFTPQLQKHGSKSNSKTAVAVDDLYLRPNRRPMSQICENLGRLTPAAVLNLKGSVGSEHGENNGHDYNDEDLATIPPLAHQHHNSSSRKQQNQDEHNHQDPTILQNNNSQDAVSCALSALFSSEIELSIGSMNPNDLAAMATYHQLSPSALKAPQHQHQHQPTPATTSSSSLSLRNLNLTTKQAPQHQSQSQSRDTVDLYQVEASPMGDTVAPLNPDAILKSLHNGHNGHNNHHHNHNHHDLTDTTTVHSSHSLVSYSNSLASTYATTMLSIRHFASFIGARGFVSPWAQLPHISTGYRINYDTTDCVKSLCSLHNETCNVYTHILGFFIFMGLFVYRYNTILYTLLDESKPDHYHPLLFYTFVFYYVGTSLCMIASTVYHLFGCMSEESHMRLYRVDMSGVIVMIVANFCMPAIVTFNCYPDIALSYAIGAMIGGLVLILMQNIDYFQQPSWYVTRITLLISFAGLVFVPYGHYLIVGPSDRASNLTMVIAISVAFYLLGLIFWIFKIPEVFAKDVFDLGIYSHGLWHACIIIASLWTEQGFATEMAFNLDNPLLCTSGV